VLGEAGKANISMSEGRNAIDGFPEIASALEKLSCKCKYQQGRSSGQNRCWDQQFIGLRRKMQREVQRVVVSSPTTVSSKGKRC
jgi:hypothetical protein